MLQAFFCSKIKSFTKVALADRCQVIKLKWYVKVQRKLLMLLYSRWEKNEPDQLPIKSLEQPVEAALTELD